MKHARKKNLPVTVSLKKDRNVIIDPEPGQTGRNSISTVPFFYALYFDKTEFFLGHDRLIDVVHKEVGLQVASLVILVKYPLVIVTLVQGQQLKFLHLQPLGERGACYFTTNGLYLGQVGNKIPDLDTEIAVIPGMRYHNYFIHKIILCSETGDSRSRNKDRKIQEEYLIEILGAPSELS
jgi:hypothetical protein